MKYINFYLIKQLDTSNFLMVIVAEIQDSDKKNLDSNIWRRDSNVIFRNEIGESEALLPFPADWQLKQGVAHVLQSDESYYPTPCFFKELQEVKQKCFFMILSHSKGFSAILTLSHCGQELFCSGCDQGVLIHIKSFKEGEVAGLIAVHSESLDQLFAQVAKYAREICHWDKQLPTRSSWGLLGSKVGWQSGINTNHQQILSQVEKAQSQLKFVIIGEGWQDLDSNGALKSFGPDPEKFPEGLAALVNQLQELGVEHVGVWHGMMGATQGVSSALATQYDLPADENGYYYLGSEQGKAFEFYSEYYQSLRAEGISFVKVGDQLSAMALNAPQQDLVTLYHQLRTAIHAAGAVQLRGRQLFSEAVYGIALPCWDGGQAVQIGEAPDLANPLALKRAIRNHLQNTHWMQQFGRPFFCEWKTSDQIMAVLQAFSRGPITIAGQTEEVTPLLSKIILPLGERLRPDTPLELSEESILNDRKFYCAYCRSGGNKNFLAFNFSGETRKTTIKEEELFALYSSEKGFLGIHHEVEVEVEREVEIFTVAPLQSGVAVFGSPLFYVMPGTIVEVDVEPEVVNVMTKIEGAFIAYSERDILEVRRNGKTVPWGYDPVTKILEVDEIEQLTVNPTHYSIAFA